VLDSTTAAITIPATTATRTSTAMGGIIVGALRTCLNDGDSFRGRAQPDGNTSAPVA
jgi:hypothetical protein